MRRMTSATGVPVSACFNANAICSSVNLLFLIGLLLPKESQAQKTRTQAGGEKREDVNWTMKRSRFREEQIIGILREQEAWAKTAYVCHRHGISTSPRLPTPRSRASGSRAS